MLTLQENVKNERRVPSTVPGTEKALNKYMHERKGEKKEKEGRVGEN